MRYLLAIAFAILLGASATAFEQRKDRPAAMEESIDVRIVGTLRSGVVAIGGESTGTTITAKGITWELDFGGKQDLLKMAESLDGQRCIVQGSLERRPGVEIKERWIVTATRLDPVGRGAGKVK